MIDLGGCPLSKIFITNNDGFKISCRVKGIVIWHRQWAFNFHSANFSGLIAGYLKLSLNTLYGMWEMSTCNAYLIQMDVSSMNGGQP